jgi:hypothetical protein
MNRTTTVADACTLRGIGAAVVCATLSFGCAEQPEQVPQAKPAPVIEEAAPEPAAVMRLPVSLNSVMVAMVNQAADPIWVAAWRNPESDADWRELERRAVQLELSGALLTVPGTGPLDDTWTSNAQWQKWSLQLRDVGAEAVAAVKARDIERISAVGDDIVAICEGCHIDFKLALPTGGQFGELSPTAEDFKN